MPNGGGWAVTPHWPQVAARVVLTPAFLPLTQDLDFSDPVGVKSSD